MYLSNAEREALGLVGFTDPAVFTISERLAVAKAKGVYVPGEESLRLRLHQAMTEIDSELPYETEEAPPAPPLDVVEEAPPAPPEVQTRPGFTDEEEEALEEAAAEAEAAPEVGSPMCVTITEEAPPADALVTEDVSKAKIRSGGLSDADFASMTKKQIVQFVLERFGVQLDGAELKDDLIVKAQIMMNRALKNG